MSGGSSLLFFVRHWISRRWPLMIFSYHSEMYPQHSYLLKSNLRMNIDVVLAQVDCAKRQVLLDRIAESGEAKCVH